MRRVLVVEDDADLREALFDLLESSGWKVTLAANGREALARLERAPVDVILLDFMMPQMDGGEFRAAQRAQPALAGIPVILMSAGRSPAQRSEIEPAAMLLKPFTPEDLRRCLNGLVPRG